MTIKTTIAALVLAAAPTLALAGGCNWEKTPTTASTCVEGQVYDAATGTCVPSATS